MVIREKPRFFTGKITFIISIVNVLALFSFWNKIPDSYKITFIIGSIILGLIINGIIYVINVNKFYKEYEKQYMNYQALSNNFKENQIELKNEIYKNEMLQKFFFDTMAVLISFDKITKEQKLQVTNTIIKNFIGNINGGKENEQ